MGSRSICLLAVLGAFVLAPAAHAGISKQARESAAQCPAAPNKQVTYSSAVTVVEGSHATVSFTVAKGCSNVKLSLASYRAPAPVFIERRAHEQVLVDWKTQFFGAGKHTLTVAAPACYYQVDFVYGDIIERFGPAGSNNFYRKQGRLIRAAMGGSGACATPTPTPDACPNIPGQQDTVPDGLVKDASGNCAAAQVPTTTHAQQAATTQAQPVALPLAQPAATPQAQPTAKPDSKPAAKPKAKKKAKKAKKRTKKVKGKRITRKKAVKAKKPRALPRTR